MQLFLTPQYNSTVRYDDMAAACSKFPTGMCDPIKELAILNTPAGLLLAWVRTDAIGRDDDDCRADNF